ncbi:cytochrome P450 4c3-like [Hyposmocoma kahamanoa]|uniref:cytochrome P450 4c3-like n=1 Tax=Hyposmocoma kahamanoa TaxID=1477025 RepID=UPI000E6D7D97|nr:cytochrome P450 4c3-like [Hyposmocoma kahamanoa]
MVLYTGRIPGPLIWPLLGNAAIFMIRPGDQLTLVDELMKRYGQYVRLWLGHELNIIVGNPADVRRLLTNNKVNKKGPAYKYMETFVGPGILSGGPTWRLHRKIANLSYNKKAIQHYSVASNKYAIRLAEVLGNKEPNVTFNVYHDVVKFTTLSTCDSIMGLSEDEIKNVRGMSAVVADTQDIYDFAYSNMTFWWLRLPLIYWLSGRKSKEKYYKTNIDLMTADIISLRKNAIEKYGVVEESMCVVDRYIMSGELTDQEVMWEIITFFTASQEATAKIASMVLLIFAHHQDWQDKVYKEIQDILGSNADYVSDEDLKKMTNLDMVYKEAVRYMPIGALIQRSIEEEVTVNDGEYVLPKGASLLLPIHLIHRDPQYWHEPNKIKPERFSPENAKNRDPNVFLPFSLGAMDCIGRVYAESLVKLIAVQVLRRVELEADGNIEDLQLHVAISVRFTKGYNLRVRPRTKGV